MLCIGVLLSRTAAGGRLRPLPARAGRGSDRGSHKPLFGRKRLCCLRLELRPRFRLTLNFEVVEILPVTDAVAENLLLAGQILRRARNPRPPPSRPPPPPRPVRPLPPPHR